MAHIPFAIDRDPLAQRLGGALPRNALCVVVGEGGAGKSLLTQRLAFGALRHGAKVAYVSTEKDLVGFLEQMQSLAYPVEMDVLSRQLAFYSTSPHGGAVPKSRRLLRLLTSHVHQDRDVVVIDSLSSLLRDGRDLVVGRWSLVDMAIERLLAWAREGRAVVVSVDPLEVSREEAGALERVADVHLDLKREMVGSEAVHLLHVKRFARPLSRVSDVIAFRVEPSAGLLVEIKGVYG